jgi:hypothetical protein
MPPKLQFARYAIIREKGRIVSMRKLTPTFTAREARTKFTRDRTLRESITRQRLTNVEETTAIGKRERPPKSIPFQGVATTVYDGETITARSHIHRYATKHNVVNAQQEAVESLHRIIALKFTKEDYNEDIGRQIVKTENLKIKTGIVYYTQLN